ncbi:MAG: hypothetical protein BGO96_12320 [Micrococcales bacterium 73-15]|uniref:hypothetical protein n=1 Tax=Salana multivorans TaxID=120377 RepID=UPI0009609068|nr:hypothetical protein [Salana multivorans]OJX97721.1 MAG: hypothetical protein BGO96_12320 [Micrococcales bacterium 73-15]
MPDRRPPASGSGRGGPRRPASGRPGTPSRGGSPRPSTPPARPSAGTFRRRRLIVLVALLAILGLGVWGILALVGGGSPSTTPSSPTDPGTSTAPTQEPSQDGQDGTDEPSPPPSPTPSKTEYPLGSTPPPPGACATDGATLTVTAPERVEPGDSVTAAIEVTVPAEAEPCLVDLGADALIVAVYSGEDQLWSSAECPFDPASRRLLLPAGGTDDASVTWNGHRSSGGCGTDGDIAAPGTYRVVVTHTLDGASVVGEATFLVE